MERITNHAFVICFNVSDSLFRVTTDRIPKINETNSLLNQIRKKYFPTSFIRGNSRILTRELKYMVQLAAFPTRAEAAQFKKNAETKLSIPAYIQQDTTSQLYNVRLKPVSSWKAALKERDQIRKKGFHNAFVLTDPVFLWLNSKYHYFIQMGAYKRLKDAHYHQDRLRSGHGYDVNVFLDKHAELFLLRLDGNYRWQKAQILSTEIGKVLGDNRVTIVGYEILQNKRNK